LYACSVKDSKGCIASSCFKVIALDARCFSGNLGKNKVLIVPSYNSIKNPWVQICVDKNAVSALLAKGDYLGNCTTTKRQATDDAGGRQELLIYPNPAHNSINIQFIAADAGSCRLTMLDMTGRLVKSEIFEAMEGENNYEGDLSVVSKGIYIISITNDEGSRQVKVIVE